jgi:hypothetical protein
MDLESAWFWLEGFAVSGTIRESMWVFPVIETLHVVTLAMTVGSIALLDFRLLGLGFDRRPVRTAARESLPWTWGAFTATCLSGFLMFASAASYYVTIPAFRYKALCLALAGINMLVLHFGRWRELDEWNEDAQIPASAKAAAALSLLFWGGVVLFGRWTGFY